MMALPECDTQVVFVEKRQSTQVVFVEKGQSTLYDQNLILYFQQTEMAFRWWPPK